jgi:hippurate hydrolase
MESILGAGKAIRVDPSTVAEDFGKYGRTTEKIKIGLFWLGSVSQAKYDESILKKTNLPALHSGTYQPDFEPSYISGVSAMSKAVIDLLKPE